MRRFWAAILAMVFATTLWGDRYFFTTPSEGARAETAIAREIGKAKSNIWVAIYSFTNNTIAKALKDAAKRGVKITIVVDEKQLKTNFKDSKAGELAKLNNIVVKIARGERSKSGDYYGIMHIKLAVIDSAVSIYGSANWSHSAFNINYEIVFIDDDRKLAAELKNAIEKIAGKSEDY